MYDGENDRPKDGEYFEKVFDSYHKDFGYAFGVMWRDFWHDANESDREIMVSALGWAVLNKFFDGRSSYGNLARDVARAMLHTSSDEVEGILTAYMSDMNEDHCGIEESFSRWFYDSDLVLWNGVVRRRGTSKVRRA